MGGIISFWWAASFRYDGRPHLVSVGGFAGNQHFATVSVLECSRLGAALEDLNSQELDSSCSLHGTNIASRSIRTIDIGTTKSALV